MLAGLIFTACIPLVAIGGPLIALWLERRRGRIAASETEREEAEQVAAAA